MSDSETPDPEIVSVPHVLDAGEHWVECARAALGQAYGGGSQFFAMWVVASEKP